jgi:inner membrane protein
VSEERGRGEVIIYKPKTIMETTNPQLNIFERLNRWIQESITVKLFSIGFLVLILLIPSTWITSLIEEREGRAEGVMQEVYQKWSGSQTLSGPILVIPYKKTEIIDRGKEGKETREITARYYFLPEKLAVKGEVNPKVLHRGIYDAAVYSATLDVMSDFVKPDFKLLGIADKAIIWKDAHMIFSISDLRGISDNPIFTVGNRITETEPSNNLGVSIQETVQPQPNYYAESVQPATYPSSKGIVAKLGWKSSDDFKGDVAIKLNLKGSKNLNFTPTGKTTLVKLGGPWNSPSFEGEFLPEEREITEAGFSANWKILHFNRPFSQQWTIDNQEIGGADFGVRLLIPVDQYQKSIRTSKYGQLIIILTFVALFLVEIIRKLRIHPFQYILIGVALIIYYTLLLSLSEQVGYNWAYAIASTATVGLISFYAASFLKNRKLILLFTSLLTVFYTFIFVIILQQDFSLLLGSIGLFLIVGALMYFSRKVEWYKEARA